MNNPWLTKNPFMSMWLSGANSVANAARGVAVSEAQRLTNMAMTEAMKPWLSLWSGALPYAPGLDAPKPRRRRAARRRSTAKK